MGHFGYCQRFNSAERKQSHTEARLNIIILGSYASSETQPLKVTITFESSVYPVLFFPSRVLSAASLTQSTARDLLSGYQRCCFHSAFFLGFFALSRLPTTQSRTAYFRHLCQTAVREPQSSNRVFFCASP